jgi:hypothetical protein
VTADLHRRFTAKAIGTTMSLAALVRSGIMADRLSSGNVALGSAGQPGAPAAMIFFRWLVPSFPGSAERVVMYRSEMSAS